MAAIIAHYRRHYGLYDMTVPCAMRALGSLARVMPRYSVFHVSLLGNGGACAAVRYAASRALALPLPFAFLCPMIAI